MTTPDPKSLAAEIKDAVDNYVDAFISNGRLDLGTAKASLISAIDRLATLASEQARDAGRYRWLRDNCVDSYPMGLDTAAEHSLIFSWQQATPEEADLSFEDVLDAAIQSTTARGEDDHD